MKTILVIFASLLILSCGQADLKTANTAVSQKSPSAAPVATTSTPKDGNYDAKGRVTKINMDLGSVELDHEEIPGVMPKMIMEFYVKDKSQLTPLKVGDSVDFVLEYKHPTETIVSIKKAQ